MRNGATALPMAELLPSPAEKEMAPAWPTPIALAIALALAFPLHRRQIAIAVLVGMDKWVVIWVLRSMKALLVLGHGVQGGVAVDEGLEVGLGDKGLDVGRDQALQPCHLG